MAQGRGAKATPRKSRAKGRTAQEQFATAQRWIEEARTAGATELRLSDLPKLDELPPELARLTALRSLGLMQTEVSDLAPLAGLTALQSLDLSGTQVSDLAPLAGLTALQSLELMATRVSDLAPLAGLTALQRLDLSGTQVSDLAPLAGLTALQRLDLSGTQVSDLAPLAGLTALQSLDLMDTQVSDLAPLARLTRLSDAVASRNALMPGQGLSCVETPAARNEPFNRLAYLDQPACTVETINELRRQQGLPAHIPKGYEQPAFLDPQREPAELVPPSEPLPTPGPATRFAVTGGRIDIVPPDAWRTQRDQAAIYHARARELVTHLANRLSKTDAVPDVAASVATLTDVLGERVEDVQPDQLRLASRSIAARARAYGHPNAQWEIGPESVSAIFELADVLVDLQGFARTDIEANERAIRQLDLTTEQAKVAKAALDEISEALEAIPEVITERVEATFANAALLSASSTDRDVKLAVEGERILLTENLALAVARSMGGSGDSEPPNGKEPPPERPERPRKRPRKPSGAGHTWDDFKDRLLKRLQKKAPEAIADAALHAMVSTIKHSPKTIAGLGAAIVAWSVTSPIVVAGGSLALTVAWIGYLLAKRQQPKA